MVNCVLSNCFSNHPLEKYVKITFIFFILLFAESISLNGFSADRATQSVVDLERNAVQLSNQWNRESFQSAVELYQKAASEWELEKKFDSAAKCYQESAALLLMLGENEAAIEKLFYSSKLAHVHNFSVEKAKTESYLSLAFLKIGKETKSKKHLESALVLSKQSNDNSAIALAYFAAAEHYYWQQENDKSLNFYLESIAKWKEIGEKKHQAEELISVAYIYMALGKSADGLQFAEHAERLFTELENQRGIALSQIATGHLLSAINEKQAALEYYSKAQLHFPKDLDFLEKGALLNGFGSIYESYQEFETSLNYRLQALEVFRQDNFLLGQLSTLHSIIGLNFRLGKESAATSYIQEAHKLSNQLKDSYNLSLVYREIGDHYFAKTDDEKAKHYYFQSLKKTESIGYKTNYALINNKLGRIYLRHGLLKSARERFETALSTSIKIKNSFIQSESLFYLATLENNERNTTKALDFVKRSIEITETLYSDVFNTNLKRTYFSNVFERYELYIEILIKINEYFPNGGYNIQALQASEKLHSRSLLETLRLSEANFTKDANPELIRKETESRNLLSLKTDNLTELLSSNAENGEIEKVEDDVRTLENELEIIKAELKQQSPVYSAIKNPPPFDVAEFQQNVLDDKTILLEFSLGEKESYLWLIGKTEITHVVLPPQDELENRIEKIRQTFDARQMLQDEDVENYRKRAAEAETVFNRETRLLSDELFGQIADKLIDKRLIIVPDGKLALLPISALPFPNSDEPFILRNEIVYQPSASLLNILPKIQNRNHQLSKDLLVFADPVFNDSDTRLTEKIADDSFVSSVINLRDFRLMDANGKIPRLFATQQEADSIAEAVGKSRTEIASGFAASRDKVLNSAISDYRILHFATHGLIDVERPEISSIVLSQFDENGQKREGFLRLQDIYALDLSSDLVVLSACQSGVGKEIKGEGMMSLNNAFLQAGAKSVLSSAWKVDDDATAEFMKRFYTNLVAEQLTPAAALRQTQIEMMQKTQFKSPFYWAAFTLQGEFRQPISISQSYFYRILFGVLGIVGVGILWRLKFFKYYSTAKK